MSFCPSPNRPLPFGPHGVMRASSVPTLRQSRETPTPTLPPIKMPLADVYSKRWTTETLRYLHHKRERTWLARKAKHQFMSFSDAEREELRCYFDALAGGGDKVQQEELEDLFISLGLASDSREVGSIVAKFDDEKTGALDFEQFLELVCSQHSLGLLKIFKDVSKMNLNLLTVISAHRRKLILDASGATFPTGEEQQFGSRVLSNFAALQRNRALKAAEAAKAVKAAEEADRKEADKADEEEKSAPASSEQGVSAERRPSFSGQGGAPMGGLEFVWRSVINKHQIVSPRPASPLGHGLTELPSPEEIIDQIIKVKPQKRSRAYRGTVLITASMSGQDW